MHLVPVPSDGNRRGDPTGGAHAGPIQTHHPRATGKCPSLAPVGTQGQWRSRLERFGHWHIIDTRMNRWSKNGVLDRAFEPREREQILRIRVEAFGLDSPCIPGHPDDAGDGPSLRGREDPPTDPSTGNSLPGFRPGGTGWLPGRTIRCCPSGTKRGGVCSGDSRACGGYSRASGNGMRCVSGSWSSCSSLGSYDSVNRPW